MTAKVIDERWEIIRPLGRGGQGEAFVVKDLSSGSEVEYALKRLINIKRSARFEKEVAAIAALQHPHLLRLVHSNLAAERPYLVSEYCERGTLEENKAAILSSDRDVRIGLFEKIVRVSAPFMLARWCIVISSPPTYSFVPMVAPLSAISA